MRFLAAVAAECGGGGLGTGGVEGGLRGDCDPSQLDNVEDDIADGGQARMFPPSGLERSSAFRGRGATHDTSESLQDVAAGQDSMVAAAAGLRSLKREAKFSLDATDSDCGHATRDFGLCRHKIARADHFAECRDGSVASIKRTKLLDRKHALHSRQAPATAALFSYT